MFPRAADILRRSGTEDAEKIIAELERQLRPAQMTLGDLIEALFALPAGALEQSVCFELPWLYPTRFDSYRGYYDQIALGVEHVEDLRPGGTGTTGRNLQDRACATVGQSFTGWKGGEYKMTARTPVWVDNPGDCSSVARVGVRSFWGGGAVLLTQRRDLT